jgi:hypothetical protein
VVAWQHGKHLVGRFFGHLTAAGLSPAEQQEVADRLAEQGAALFWSQDAADQRHAYDVAERVAAALPGDDEAYAAALLHDVGKRHSRLGAIGRSIATVLDAAGAPLPAPMRRYRGHGALGAEDLAAAGYGGLVVAFAAHHPAAAPHAVDRARWQALLDADG